MNRNFWLIAIIGFINALSFTILIPIIYLYGKEFGLSDFQTSCLFAVYSISQFFATPLIGKLSDYYGRKPLLILSLAGTVGANFLAGVASTAWLLFLARFLDGITGGNVSVAQAVISDVTTRENRAQAFGIYGASFGVGFVVGPALSLVAQQFSLGASFLGSSVIALIALLITLFLLPETLERRSERIHNLFDLGLENLVKGLFMPRVGILFIINFFIGTTFTIFTFAFQPYFIRVLSQNSQSLTLMFVMLGIMGSIMQTWGIKRLTASFSLLQIFFLALFMRSLAITLMPAWPNLAYFVSIGVVFSIFNSLVQPIVNTLISLNARPEEQGIVLGVNASYLSISNACGPLIAGLVVHQTDPSSYGKALFVAGTLTFAVLGLAIVTRHQYSAKVS
jgi:predicted MFS family arabinose efflux permease